MAYVMCVVFVALIAAVYARSVAEVALEGSTSDVIRVKRHIMNGSGGNGCAINQFRFGLRCLSCEDIGKKRRKTMKVCNNKCVEAHRSCSKSKLPKKYA